MQVPFGNNTYRLATQPLTLAPQSPRSRSSLIKLKNLYLTVPVFSASVISWPGSSYIAARVTLTPGQPFSIVMPLAPVGNFCPVLYDPIAKIRYKLLENVGEILDAPLYAGEILPQTGVYLDFWTVADGQSSMTLPATWNIPLTGLILPNDWWDTSNTVWYAAATPTITTIPYA